ncbi:MAG: ATP synthase F1 subunit gamma [Clostridia bacterium]|nr:ATP synthase F1 subunit gamma [Clostridia bacterium]
MANITDIKARIKSINDTRQITKAMELISVSKVKRAQENYDKNLLYFKSLIKAISDLLEHGDCVDCGDRYFKLDKSEKTCYIVISSDKGLAGGYNHNVLNLAHEIISKDDNRQIITFGRTASEFFKRNDIAVDKEYNSIGNPTLKHARSIAYDICDEFEKGNIGSAYVIFTDMDEGGGQKPVCFQIVPLDRSQFNQSSAFSATMIYDPSPDEVLQQLIPQYITGLIFSVLLHATVSEHKARMVAMESATRNADEMLDKLRLEYNRARQESITNELLEIVSGSSVGN